jgi:hypothetical protein
VCWVTMGCGSSTEAAAAPEAGGAVAAAAAAPAAAPAAAAAAAPAAAPKKAAAPAAAPKKAAAAPAAAEPSADGIERNAGGCEEPHSDDPELWNIDGTEMDLNAKYKIGGQMWYLQDRAKDAIKAGKPIAGVPFNQAATDSGRLFDAGDDD